MNLKHYFFSILIKSVFSTIFRKIGNNGVPRKVISEEEVASQLTCAHKCLRKQAEFLYDDLMCKCVIYEEDASDGFNNVVSQSFYQMENPFVFAKTYQVCVSYGEPETYTLSCPSFSHLRIVRAFYGRESDTVCPARQMRLGCTNDVTQRATNTCNGKKNCVLDIRESELGDPCPGKSKYYEVSYNCEE